jgi:hypothetical protein
MNIMDEFDAKGAARRKYDREWRERNPSKVKAIKERFWAKHAEPGEDLKAAQRRYCREWRTANKDKVAAAKSRYWLNRTIRESESGKPSQ